MHLARFVTTGLRAIAVAGLSFAATVMPAQSAELWVPLETTAADISTLNGLMQPIAPLIGGTGSNSLLTQSGTNNATTASLIGSGNLALVQQTGSNNRAAQAVEGHNSAALLFQGGHDNNVIQASKGDNNFQLVAVSGHGNDVAYVQVGNELAGALDVTGSTNSSVFALQTPGSGRYLMPSGLSGLKDQVVVVVPGRMYIINKNAL